MADASAPLWTVPDVPRSVIGVRQQKPQECVATCLAMLTDQEPICFSTLNTQDPVAWSEALHRYGMKLAYCPCDLRRVGYYISELRSGTWLVGYYLTDPVPTTVGADGWLCESHLIIVHNGRVYDPADGMVHELDEHVVISHPTKRIFRVVPIAHPRGL